MRVASYNIRKAVGTDGRRDPDRIIRVLASLDADVVALQEADLRRQPRRPALDRAALRTGAGLVPVEFDHGRDSLGWHGNAILVRPEVAVVSRSHHDLPGLEPRGTVMAELEVDEQAVRVVGAHLGLLRPSRRAQARALADLLSNSAIMPTILMGDLNERSRETGLGILGRMLSIHDAGPSFPSRFPLLPLDRIAVSAGLRVLEARAVAEGEARTGSDHLPIVARLARS